MKQPLIPVLDTEQMIEVDRLMIDSYGISLAQMMENAGRNLAWLAKKKLGGSVFGKKVCVVAGGGNNGGGGLVAARHLSNWGAEVTCLAVKPTCNFKPVPARQLEIVRHMPISVVFAGSHSAYIDWCTCDLIIDAIVGYGLNRAPGDDIAAYIEQINSAKCIVLSLDVPSGLHTTNGFISETVVRANATLTLALPKQGLLKPYARELVGELYVGDISVPPMLYCQLGLKVDPGLFEHEPVIVYTSNGF